MGSPVRLLLFLIFSATGVVSAQTRDNADRDSLQIPEVAPAQLRAITTRDLTELRDIETLAVSPDGKFVAFNVRQAVIESNSYRTAWFVASTSGAGRPVNVGNGGDPQMLFFANGNTAGEFQSKPAQWSRDGAWMAYLVKRDGAFQVWRSRRDGTAAEQLTHNPANVRDFLWNLDGSKIYLSVEGQTRKELQRALQDEGRQGFLLDERFDPVREQSEPVLPRSGDPWRLSDNWGSDAQVWVYDISAHSERKAATSDLEDLSRIRAKDDLKYKRAADAPNLWVPPHVAYAANQQYVAWLDIARPDDNSLFPDFKVFAAKSRTGGIPIPCTAQACTGRIWDLWWSGESTEVIFDRAEGVNHASHALYAWSVLEDRVRRILFTDDALLSCSNAGNRLICLHESPTAPRRIVSISFKDGAITTVVDPNPEFRNLRFSEVERFEWTNEFGHAAFAHFLKPLDHKPGKKYPLVVVTYRSWGFLRGGVGDEYPAHVFAANGFCVLSFDVPQPTEYIATGREMSEIMRALDRDLLEDRSVLSSLEKGLSLVEASGLVDPNRVAITGLSFGAQTTWFSLLYGHRSYGAAIVSSTSYDPMDFYIAPEWFRKESTKMGRGLPEGPDGAWWRKVSPALNVDRIHTPILMNVADRELIYSMQTIWTLKEYGKPLEVYVYPDEWHVKGWPAHRYAIYQRNLDWLNFWLKSEEDSDPAKAEQYARWRVLRRQHEENMKKLADAPKRN